MKVYRFVTKNTIEERICEIRESKRKLFDLTIEDYKGNEFDDKGDETMSIGVLKNLLRK